MLVVTIVLVRHLDKVNSSVSNFENREIIKDGKTFKVLSKAQLKACFLREQVRQKKALTAKDEDLLRSKELLGALVISHQSF